MKKSIISRLSNLVSKLPLGDKLVIIANVLVHDWRINPPVTGFLFEKEKYSKIQTVYHDLDSKSQRILQRFLWRELYLPNTLQDARYFFYNYSRIFSK